MNRPSRYIRICADDFALDDGTTQGIISLLTRQRITATSCLVEAQSWPDAAKSARLAGVPSEALGLHFNLTEGLSVSDRSLKQRLLASLFGHVDQLDIENRLQHQLDLFEQHWCRSPAHVDGHQHVHIFPVIRNVLLNVLKNRYPDQLPKLRNIAPLTGPSDAPIKYCLLNMLGSRFSQQALDAGFLCNSGFAGAYSLSGDVNYAALLNAWLLRLPAGSEIMCHPASSLSDSHGKARQNEYDYLSGDLFANYLHDIGVGIATHVDIPHH